MKIISFLLLVVLMQVSAAGLAQKINLNEKNVSLKSVIEKVRLQSGYNFLYIENVLDQTKPVNIQIQNVEFADALKRIFSNQPLDYEIKEKTVVIRKKEPSMLSRIIESTSAEDIRGRILDERGRPLQGVTVSVKGSENVTQTNPNGEFIFNNLPSNAILEITHVGYKTKEIIISKIKSPIEIILELKDLNLEEVNIVSTGYQKIPKERATGSFEIIDNKLLNRSAGTDVFSRLDAVTTGTLFFKYNNSISRRPYEGLLIRGLSSYFTYKPLIIIDNFPYEGDPNNINPNDVENVTILKDAAAASIWGARAGNGVIVITTKKGSFNQPFRITLNSNVTLTDKPDLHYLKQMSSSEFIDVEKLLFEKGYYDSKLDPQSPFWALTPVVELLTKQRNLPANDLAGRNLIDSQIDALRKYDVRDDILKYTYRQGVKQQHSLSIAGGDKKIAYIMSAGYDKNLDNLIVTNYDRLTFRVNTTINPIKDLSVDAAVFYTKNHEAQQNQANSIRQYGDYDLGGGIGLYPYARLADNQGNPLVIDKYFRGGYLDTLGHGLLMDWKYRPLAEKDQSSSILSSQDILLNFGVRYKINPYLNAELKYQYQKTNGLQKDLFGLGSFYVRTQVNWFTQFDNNGIIEQPFPKGDMLTLYNSIYNSNNWRGQLNFDKTWNDKHQVTAIAGAELRESHSESNASRLYGYDSKNLTFTNVDNVKTYPLINGIYGGAVIEGVDPSSFSDITNRNVSVFANASYTFDKKYILSASARRDATNLFGVTTNSKWKPLWSLGAKWNIYQEDFYKSKVFPNLSLRLTYGQSGNIPTGVPAVATISYAPGRTPTNYPYASSNNPPNSNLRWENISMLNFGVDFGLKNNRISGSFEFYNKVSKDVLASAPVDPTTGATNVMFNSAEIKGKGIEAQINSRNLILGDFEWGSNLLFTYNKPIVTRYDLKNTDVKSYVTNNGTLNQLVGKDVYGVFAYPFAGLDHETGDPIGYLNDIKSTDYSAILSFDKPVSVLKYFGSSTPLYYGAVRNNFSWRGVSLSINISYRFAYFIRRDGIQYDPLITRGNVGHGEYVNRWQKPGDEAHTNVPSLNLESPDQFNRDRFYRYSTEFIVKGDNIRLEDINMGYTFKKLSPYMKNCKVYLNANNLGMIWHANKLGIDPDYQSNLNIPPSRTIVLGLSAEF